MFVIRWGAEGSGDGEFIYPKGIAVATDGSVYVSDQNNRRIQNKAPDCNGRGLSLWLKSVDFVPICCLAGVRGTRTHIPRSSRGITDLKSVAVIPGCPYRPVNPAINT